MDYKSLKEIDDKIREMIIDFAINKTICKQDALDQLEEVFGPKAVHREFWRLVHDKVLIPQKEPFTFRLSEEVDVAQAND